MNHIIEARDAFLEYLKENMEGIKIIDNKININHDEDEDYINRFYELADEFFLTEGYEIYNRQLWEIASDLYFEGYNILEFVDEYGKDLIGVVNSVLRDCIIDLITN